MPMSVSKFIMIRLRNLNFKLAIVTSLRTSRAADRRPAVTATANRCSNRRSGWPDAAAELSVPHMTDTSVVTRQTCTQIKRKGDAFFS
jgi:hypothetical protein